MTESRRPAVARSLFSRSLISTQGGNEAMRAVQRPVARANGARANGARANGARANGARANGAGHDR